ncbi:hypothetical protein [Sulfurimonas sp.]|uniref:hypothetical protein n=1 Tax=Sulfurimonas sp. TaxID=2022749 RepID=UPI0025FE05B0|nr:hypothetical protein [Sulfurimonas sp.]MBW6487701.1 hypothetical protein [Sulfurimonas sp.]
MKTEKIQDLIKQLKRDKKGCIETIEQLKELIEEQNKKRPDEYLTDFTSGRISSEKYMIEKIDTYLSYLEISDEEIRCLNS